MAVRGRLARRSSSASAPSPVHLQKQAPSPNTPICDTPSSPSPTDTDLIVYFNNAVLPRFQIPDEAVELDFDAVMQDATFQQAILAISQAHYAMNSKSTDANILVLRKRARHSAIGSFRQLLHGGVADETAAQRLFTINVLLCMLDGIIEPSDELSASMCHLRGGFAILSEWSRTPIRMLVQNGLSAHLLSIFATMDLVHALLNGDRPYFDPITWHMFANVQTWFGKLHARDPFLTILKGYSEMAGLGSIMSTNPCSEDDRALIERCLSDIESTFSIPKRPSPHELPLPDPNASNEIHWATFCSIYRVCGAIYLQRALRMKPIDDDVVQAVTRRGVEQLIDDVLPGTMSHCLIFPILVIGSHCIHSQDRRAVLEALSPSSSYLSFGSLRIMTDFLRQSWDEGNSSRTWWESFQPISEMAFLF